MAKATTASSVSALTSADPLRSTNPSVEDKCSRNSADLPRSSTSAVANAERPITNAAKPNTVFVLDIACLLIKKISVGIAPLNRSL